MYCGDTAHEAGPEKCRAFNERALCLRILLDLLFALGAQYKRAKPVQQTYVQVQRRSLFLQKNL